MSIQRTKLMIPVLTLLSLSMSAAFSAEAVKKGTTVKAPKFGWDIKTNIKVISAKPGPGAGADEHGCIAPQIWQMPNGPCVTDVLPGGGSTQNGMQTK